MNMTKVMLLLGFVMGPIAYVGAQACGPIGAAVAAGLGPVTCWITFCAVKAI